MIAVGIFRGDAGDDELLAFTELVENLILLLQTICVGPLTQMH